MQAEREKAHVPGEVEPQVALAGGAGRGPEAPAVDLKAAQGALQKGER